MRKEGRPIKVIIGFEFVRNRLRSRNCEFCRVVVRAEVYDIVRIIVYDEAVLLLPILELWDAMNAINVFVLKL